MYCWKSSVGDNVSAPDALAASAPSIAWEPTSAEVALETRSLIRSPRPKSSARAVGGLTIATPNAAKTAPTPTARLRRVVLKINATSARLDPDVSQLIVPSGSPPMYRLFSDRFKSPQPPVA